VSGRRLGLALGLGVAVACVIELLLAWLLHATRAMPSGSAATPILLSKAEWLIAALLAAAVAPSLTPSSRSPLTWSAALRLAGTILIVAPLVWWAATFVVFVVATTLTGAWATDGLVLLQPRYYSTLLTANGPWLLAAAALRAISRHVV
jgi:hypothetical protein